MAGKGQLLPNHDPAMIGWNAPIPVVRRVASIRLGSTLIGRSGLRQRIVEVGREPDIRRRACR
jgi:hypothetical protein